MAFNIKRGQIITLLDIFLIVVIFFIAKSYLDKYSKNYISQTKNNIKYTLVINNQKIKQNELLNIKIRVENKSKEKKIIEFKKAIPFNYVIEKDGKFIYKRDITESLSEKSKNIYLNKYGKIEFGTEWYGNSFEKEEIKPGIYTLTVYNTDLDISLRLNFEIIQEAE